MYTAFNTPLIDRVSLVCSLVGKFLRFRFADKTVADLMRPPVFVSEDLSQQDLLTELQDSRRHMAMLVNESGGARAAGRFSSRAEI